MEPFSTFATIVGLVSAFKGEERAIDGDQYNDLVAWLQHKRHEDVIKELESNQKLATEVKQLLSQSHSEVVEILSNLDQMLMKLASHIQGVQGIANAIDSTAALSEQSLSILRQFDKSGASKFLELPMRGTTLYMFLDGSGGQITIEDQRFVEDDLNELLKLNLLLLDFNGKGQRVFKITRLAASYIETVVV
ncbi:TPA: hypothetical protein NJZ52_004401 [Vibrio parahaemolyticus]|nr:hypothetical protein [Vibrio parahaemolyticus]